MTCIVGIAKDGHAWLGSDSGAWINNVVHVTADGKVFEKGEFLFGYCGLRRLGDILRYCGYLEMVNSREQFEGRIVFALRGQIYYCDSNFAIHKPTENYIAMGCAEEAALAVLDARDDLPPKERLGLALTIAARRVDGVRAPFHFVSSKRDVVSAPHAVPLAS